MRNAPRCCLLVVAALALGPPACLRAGDTALPNVVLVLTDNHGAWTLGCYGNKDIRTPHIDRLATEGVLFERCYSSNAVCSPTRATLLTGLVPSQHGVHCYLGGEKPDVQIGPAAYGAIEEFRSLPEILSDAGYTCGLVGKWHLGDSLRPQEGFNYWVTMPVGSTRTFYDAEVIEEGRTRKEPQYLTDFWTDRALRFIDENKGRRFFLLLAYNGPYGLGQSLLRPSRNRHAAYYADKELPSFPRQEPHPWLFNNRDYINNAAAIRRYAAEISGVDDGVGRVLEALRRHELDQKTLVIFTADQGLAGGHSGFWGMGDHTRPLTAYDWTMHVPHIWRHAGAMAGGRRARVLISNYDFLPTLLDYLGLKDKSPAEPELPGHSYAAALRGKEIDWDRPVFFEFQNVRAIRTAQWKFIERFPDGPGELYDLKLDPGERRNLVDQPALSDTRKQLQRQLGEFFQRHADPKYDLWRGGRSKTRLLSQPQENEPENTPAP